MQSEIAPPRRGEPGPAGPALPTPLPRAKRSPMWLSPPCPGGYDRCVSVAGRHVCRRCLWFYPVCFATTILSLAGLHWPVAADPWILWLTAVPVVIEWWAEHRGWAEYS